MDEKIQERLCALHDQGYDLSEYEEDSGFLIRCSQCEALVINGIATHERGCPNIRRHYHEIED
jgi:hypothetical protein